MATTEIEKDHSAGKSRLLAPVIGHDEALVHLRNDKLVTNTHVFAREFRVRHGNVLRSLDSLKADGTINQLDFESIEYSDATGEKRRMIELTERGVRIEFFDGVNRLLGGSQ